MSASSRLWRRAPAWRFFLYTTFLFLVLGLIFPTPFVSRHTGWLHALTRHLPSFGSKTPSDPDAPPETDETRGNSTGSAGPDLNDPERFVTPDIATAITGAIPFGGHSLPLPAGVWHPVLSGQYGLNGMMSLNVLVRTDRGIVTGVLIASTTNQELPRDVIENAYNHCHDDRNYHSTILADHPDGKIECAYLTAAYLGPNGAISTDPLIQLAFKRLTTLGFPMPSLFVVASWLNSSGAGESTKGSTNVTLLLSPTRPGTVVLRAPLPYWDKRLINRAPDALEFVRHVDNWFAEWVPVMRHGMTTDYSGTVPDALLAKDPAAP
ncbi:hypothetical protein [Asaia bogorensis]|uniref:hypothetical protein n=1 Tax=Asaia bogorensis TaxID=91915 RepID=UPI000EFB5547|nr:hypothetical protein [Asaia bogorensis]